MSRGRLVVHGHFYQPSRVDPFSGAVPADPSAAPARDWNTRVSEECYRPNAERGNLGHMSWDLGPTLADWLVDGDPLAYRAFVAGDRGINGIAQPFHHAILPLASAADRRTEIRWGMRDFEVRFGRPATGMWLPETAVDLPTLRMLAEAGIRSTILAPWQVAEPYVETRRPYRVELGDGRDILVALYDADLSAAISFEPHATSDADRFAREGLEPRLASGTLPDDEPPLVVIATDGELYGHHLPFRELFLERLVQPLTDGAARGYEVVSLEAALDEPAGRPFRTIRIAERTSWSCHHGVLRWGADCACASDGSWKWPLRAALERLAAGIDTVTETRFAGLAGSPDPWAARDAYVDVVLGLEAADAFARRWLSGARSGRRSSAAAAPEVATFLALMAGPALAAGHVQQRRLVLGRPDATGDGGGPARRGAGGPDRRRPGRCRARAPAGSRPRALQLAGPSDRRRDDLRSCAGRGRSAGRRGPGLTPRRQEMPTGYTGRRGSCESIRLSTPKRSARAAKTARTAIRPRMTIAPIGHLPCLLWLAWPRSGRRLDEQAIWTIETPGA